MPEHQSISAITKAHAQDVVDKFYWSQWCESDKLKVSWQNMLWKSGYAAFRSQRVGHDQHTESIRTEILSEWD